VPPASNTTASIGGRSNVPAGPARALTAREPATNWSSTRGFLLGQHEAGPASEAHPAALPSPRLGEEAPDRARVERVLGRVHARLERLERVAVSHLHDGLSQYRARVE